MQVAMLDHGRLIIEENPIRYQIEEAPVISQFPQSRANLVFNNAANDPRLSEGIRDSFAVRGVNSAMVVPVATGTTWLGAVIAEHFGDDTFTSEGLRRARSIADQAALATESQMLLEQFQTTVARERALREVAERIRQANNRQAVLDIAAGEVSQVIGVTPDEAQAITMRTTQRRKLGQDERDLIESITNQVDLAIQNLNLLEAAEQAAFREQIINEMTADLQRAVTVDEVMQTAVRLLASNLGDYDVRLKLTERQRRLLQQAGGTGPLSADDADNS
jgi:GAF domain-containing protein